MLSNIRGSFARRRDRAGRGSDLRKHLLKEREEEYGSNFFKSTAAANNSKSTKNEACSCNKNVIRAPGQDAWSLDKILDSVLQQDGLWLDVSNPEMHDNGYPAHKSHYETSETSNGDHTESRTPILMPNEIVLQRIKNKRAVHRLSLFKLQQTKLQCRKCSHMQRTIVKLIVASFIFNKTKLLDYQLRCSFLDGDDYDLEFLMFQQDDHEELTHNMHNGCLYATSERLIFVPNRENVEGFSIPFKTMKSMMVIDSVKPKTLRRKWFFVCYWGSFVTSIEFSTFDKADSFMKMCANIRFEHTVSSCLPPKYIDQCLELRSSTEHWCHEDNRLPTYTESEEALWKYLQLRGLLKDAPNEILDSGYERSTHLCDLIAIACQPPTEDKHNPAAQEHIQKILRQQHIPAVLKMVNSVSRAGSGKSESLVEFLLWY